MTTSQSTDGIRLSGSWTGEEAGWDEQRAARWVGVFVMLGIAAGVAAQAALKALPKDPLAGDCSAKGEAIAAYCAS